MTTSAEALKAALANPKVALKELDRLDAEDRLLEFIKQGWSTLEPGRKFVHGWAVGAICEHLEAVSRGEIKRLLINVPPGCTKSMTTNVFWPSWEWIKNPHLKYISASYAQDLTTRDNVRGRTLMESEWYQGNWGQRFEFKGDQNAKLRYENTVGGFRQVSSVGASLIGHRGDRIIVDDPHDVQGVESDIQREESLRWFAETLPTRLNDLDESAIVVIMQRVHERDVSGLILKSELGYEHLCLPMEFEPDHPHPSTLFKDPRTKAGELLWPERFSPEAVEQLKKVFRSWGGSYAEAGQLQQRPAPRAGGMFQRKDFVVIDSAPEGLFNICRGWDLAATKDGHGAFTVGCKMASHGGLIYILDVQRGRWGPHEVMERIKACAQQDGFLVRQSIPQDPGQAGKAQRSFMASNLEGWDARFSPESGSKEDRARPLSAQCEAGNVRLVRGPWVDAFINEAAMFPSGEFKDQVDAASRAYADLLHNRAPDIGAAPEMI